MHYQHAGPIEKRDTARLVNKCIGYDPLLLQYTDPHCTLTRGMRAVVMFCQLTELYIELGAVESQKRTA